MGFKILLPTLVALAAADGTREIQDDPTPAPRFGSASIQSCGNPQNAQNSGLLDNLAQDLNYRFTAGEDNFGMCVSNDNSDPRNPAGVDCDPTNYEDDILASASIGRRKRDVEGDSGDRIVGGAEAMPGSWPWQARVRACSTWRCTYLCGGSVLSAKWVVTAAHCLPYRATKGNVTVGAHYLFDTGENGSTAKNYTISSVVGHKDWNRYKRLNDIALVKTHFAMQMNANVQPICIPNQSICFNPGTLCVVTGWGYTQERGGGLAVNLQEVAVRVVKNDWCRNQQWYGNVIDGNSQVCAGYADGGKDSCSGDSGGPLVCRLGADQPWVLYGLVSWGYGCARRQKPGVYSKLPHFRPWIESEMNKNGGSEGFVVGGGSYPCATCTAKNWSEQEHDQQCYHTGFLADNNGNDGGDTVTEAPPTEAPTPPPTTTTTQAPTTTTSDPAVLDCGTNLSKWTQNVPYGILYSHSGFGTSPYLPNKSCAYQYYPTQEVHDVPAGSAAFTVAKVNSWNGDYGKFCWRGHDFLRLKCGVVSQYYCHRQSWRNFGLHVCKDIFTVWYKTNGVTNAAGGEVLFKKIVTPVNTCGYPKTYTYTGSDDGSTNVPLELSVLSIYPFTSIRSKRCPMKLEVAAGKKACLVLDWRKTWLTAREKRNKQRKFEVVSCNDYINLTDGVTGQFIKKVCGRRSLRYNFKHCSPSNVLQVELVTDGRSHRRERLVGMVRAD